LKPEQQSQMFNEALNLDLWLRASVAASHKHKANTRKLDDLNIEQSSLTGRMAEINNSLEAERVARDEFEEQHAGHISRLKKQVAAKGQELASLAQGGQGQALAGQPYSPRAAPGQAGPSRAGGQGLAGQLAALQATARATAKALGRARGQAGALAGAYRTAKTQRGIYLIALEGNKTCPACGQPAPKGHLSKQIAALDATLASTKRELNEVEANIARLEIEADRWETAIAGLHETQVKINKATVELDSLERTLETAESASNPHKAVIKALKLRLETLGTTLAANKDQLLTVENVLGVCTYWADSFKEIRLSLIDKVLSELEMAVTHHAENLGLLDWRIEFQTERVAQSGNVSTVFTVLLYPPDREEPIKWESYSGGESQRLQLATTFALSEVLLTRAGITPSVEIFDEPTKGLSPEGVEDLLEHLRERAKDLERSILFCDHHSLERGAFDGIITVIKDDKGSHIKET